MAEVRNRSESELASRDSLINCLLTRVQECEDDKLALDQNNEKLKNELKQMKEVNESLQITIKQLQQTIALDGHFTPRKAGLEDETWMAEYIKDSMTTKHDHSPPLPSLSELIPTSFSELIPTPLSELDHHDPMVVGEDYERIELLPPQSSSIPPPPSPPASVDDFLAFLVWLFLHIAVFIDSHRKVYQPV
jgi:hypothetical protein